MPESSPEEILKLLNQSAEMLRNDIRQSSENHFDLSDRSVATLATLRTITDGSKLVDAVAQGVTKADPTL